MNLLADLLIFASVLALAYCAVALLTRLPVFGLREITVATAPRNVSVSQLEHTARTRVTGNFFTVNLDAVRAAFEKLPWVRRVEARRVWPSGIELAIEEHEAAAQWRPEDADGRLVNVQGEVFQGGTQKRLPALSGPEGASTEMLERYREFARLLAPLSRELRWIGLSARRAWQLRLDDGLLIDLGRDQARSRAADRLGQFVQAWPEISARLPVRAAVIDLRYPAGFSVRPGAPRNHAKSE